MQTCLLAETALFAWCVQMAAWPVLGELFPRSLSWDKGHHNNSDSNNNNNNNIIIIIVSFI